VTLIASIAALQIGAAPKPGNGRESTNTGYGMYRAKRASEVPVKWASKTTTRDAAKGGAEAIALSALPNRKRDVEIVKRPVADWYDRLDGSSDYYNEEGRHIIRLGRVLINRDCPANR
jgi:hypothetical protein